METLRALPTCDVAEQPNVRFHYAFALSRCVPAGGWHASRCPHGVGDLGIMFVGLITQRHPRVRRRNRAGDRAQALSVLLPAVERGDGAAPDLLCLCGRIYKDTFISSGFTDTRARDQALYW